MLEGDQGEYGEILETRYLQVHSNAIIEALQAFIGSYPDAREMRKAQALKLVYQGYSYEEIAKILDVRLVV